jgi:hypothetical protein
MVERTASIQRLEARHPLKSPGARRKQTRRRPSGEAKAEVAEPDPVRLRKTGEQTLCGAEAGGHGFLHGSEA